VIELRTLGEIQLRASAGERLKGRRKELAVLAVVAARCPRPVRRAELADLFWGERGESRARHSLRQSLLLLRRAVGEGLQVDAETVTLAAGVVAFDLASFHTAVDEGRPADAVSLWHGDFLPGLEDTGGEAFRAWLEAEREHARRRLAGAMQQLVSQASTAGDRPRLLELLEQWAELLPLDEQAQARLIEELHGDGRTGAALSRHAEHHARVRRELDEDPSEDFLRLRERLVTNARPGDPRAGAAPSAALIAPELVGRDAHRTELRDSWQRVRNGEALVATVEGPDGLGKTALCEHFLRGVQEEPAPSVILQARAATAMPGPAAVARELLLGLLPVRGLSGAADRDLAAFALLLPELRDRWPQLLHVDADEPSLHRSILSVLGAVAQEQPVIAFIDDIAVADDASRRLVLSLARQLPAGVLLLLTMGVQEESATALRTELGRLTGVRRLTLPPLDRAQVDMLLASMLELPAVQRRALADRLHAESGGNPFHAVEVVNTMVDDGLLTLDPQGIWRLTLADDAALPVPAGVRDVVRRRIDALDTDSRAVVTAATALSGPLEVVRLAPLAGLTPERAQDALENLISRRLFRTAEAPGTVDFAHATVRRAAAEAAAAGPALRPGSARPGRRAGLVAAGLFGLLLGLGLLLSRQTIEEALGALKGNGARGEPAPRIVALIPFSNASDDSASDYLSVGLHNSIVVELGRLGSIIVPSHISTMQYRGAEEPLSEIARELAAAAVVHGTVRRADDRVILDVQMADSSVGSRLWQRRYERPVDEVMEIEREFIADLIGTLRLRATRRERARLQQRPTQSAEAYDLYLRGRGMRMLPGVSALEQTETNSLVRSYYSRARDLDPNFARARANLAIQYMLRSTNVPTLAISEQARLEAEAALRIEPDLSEAHTALTMYWQQKDDTARAANHLQLAIDGAPGNVYNVIRQVGFYIGRGMWEEALAGAERVARMEPRDPSPASQTATIFTRLRRYDEAVAAWNRYLALAPGVQSALISRGEVFVLWQGTTDSLAAALREIGPGDDGNGMLTWAHVRVARLQRRWDEVLAILDRSSASVSSASHLYRPRSLMRAEAYDALGDRRRARVEYEAALAMLTDSLSIHPDDARMRLALALAYAGLDRREEAFAEARRAMEIAPPTRVDRIAAATMAGGIAVYAKTGYTNPAVHLLETMLNMPAGTEVSGPLLRLDPTYDGLRSDPRFDELSRRTTPP
jgi:TolB-like protein/DNA-binding SARP family transcriptional activator/Flp pilus assembly protein TadD